MTWLKISRYLNASVEATAHYMKVWSYCPHCETQTPWMTRSASGHYSCLECGNNPMKTPDVPQEGPQGADQEAAERDAAAPTDPERPAKRGTRSASPSRQAA
ncbi:MAG: hypothetical protein PPP56_06835 [Longimonas sp.]|uniref:hypothetical protein n=1 Tax=Longimonas sp. TaxID=2039626 RepID=UPI00334CA25B